MERSNRDLGLGVLWQVEPQLAGMGEKYGHEKKGEISALPRNVCKVFFFFSFFLFFFSPQPQVSNFPRAQVMLHNPQGQVSENVGDSARLATTHVDASASLDSLNIQIYNKQFF
jgi:hypothetical protein